MITIDTSRTIAARAPVGPTRAAVEPSPTDTLELNWGYRPSVASMDLAGAHTIRDIPGYLDDKLGAETVSWVNRGKPVVIAMGEGQRVSNRLKQAGWELGAPVKKPVDYHLQQVRHARTPDGKEVMMIWRVNGQDRTDHLQSMLRMTGANETQVATVGTLDSLKDDYLRTFKKLGPAPDLVVYGMPKTGAASVMSTHPFRNLTRLVDAFSRRGVPEVDDTETTPDTKGLKMEVMELKNGQRIWYLPPLYGDMSKDLLDALLEHGVKKINFLGTAGGINPSLQVSQVVSPNHWVHENGQGEDLTWLTPTQGQDGLASYSRVSTPNLETAGWARRMEAQKVDVIEVELGYWLEATRNRPDVEMRVQTVVSDVLQGPNHRDITKWSFTGTLATRQPVLTAIKEALGNPSHDELVVRDYRSVPLVEST